MNASVIVLEEVELDQHQVADVLTCLVETIAFNRALGAMRPAYVRTISTCALIQKLSSFHFCLNNCLQDTMKTLEVDYPVCGIRGIEEQVRTLADTQLEDKMETIGPNLKRGRVSVEFYITAKAPSKFLGMHKSHILWEKWILTLLVTTGVVGEEDSEMSRTYPECSHTEMVPILMETSWCFCRPNSRAEK